MFPRAPLGPWSRRLVAFAGISAGVATALALNGRAAAAVAAAAIATAATLSVLHHLVNRETL